MKREERRQQANQIRKNKREEAIALKRSLGGVNTAPFLTCVIPLHKYIDPLSAMAILENCDDQAVVSKESRITHITLPRLKQRFSFIVLPSDGKFNEFQVLDYLKVVDSTLLLVPADSNDDPIDAHGSKILQIASAQGIPTPMLGLMGLESIAPKKRSTVKVKIQKQLTTAFPNERVMTLDSNSDGLNMLRRIGGQKRNLLLNKERRPHMYAEQIEYDYGANMLKLTGFLRGKPLSVNSLVHLPGLGDFQMTQIDAPIDPFKEPKIFHYVETPVVARAVPSQQVPLIKENVPDEMDADQPDIGDEEIKAAQAETKNKKLIKRVPKGMSDYQASWIPDVEELDEDDDDSSSEDENSEDYMSCASDDDQVSNTEVNSEDDVDENMSATSELPVNDEAYDKLMNFEEERKTLDKILAAQEEKKFPDEIDTPQDVPARVRFQKYRGLESFRTSPWDKKENLPSDYARIFQFQNFDRTKKRIVKELEDIDGVQPGWYITIYVTGVEPKLWSSYTSANNYVIVYGMLPHEHQMSVLNSVLKRVPGSEIPIKSKDRLIVQCGYRRFIVNPIYSQHTNADKHKYERYFRPEETVVATFYAPIQFPPAPILCFLENPNSSLSLVASGHLLSCNPDRIVLKRVVLSGHPYKIHRKTATIRYMFFNKDDVHYFKPCKLRTKCGRLGHIKESLGTHGHMKCVFDGQLKSFDTVFLNLYKRVFPKWTFEDCVVHVKQEGNENEDEMKE